MPVHTALATRLAAMGLCGSKPEEGASGTPSKPNITGTGAANKNVYGDITAGIVKMGEDMSGQMSGTAATETLKGKRITLDNGLVVKVSTEELGRGNYGVVYKGQLQDTSKKMVAVKEILFPADDPEECEFLKEVRAAL